MEFEHLLAKSKKPDEPWTNSMSLPGHLCDVYNAAIKILDSTGDNQLHALGLPVGSYRDRFRKIVLLSALVHDLGKANDHFQGMIHGWRDVRINPQGIRHEWVTVLMLKHLRNWLLPVLCGNEIDIAIMEWAVAGHHPAHHHTSPPRICPPGAGVEIKFLIQHGDFAKALLGMGKIHDSKPPEFSHLISRNLVGNENVFLELAHWHRGSQKLWDKLRKSPEARLVPAVKNCLIAADIAGSALPNAIPDETQRWDWIRTSFEDKPQHGDLQEIVDFRLEKCKDQGGSEEDNADRKRFQDDVAASKSSITYLKAGCGSGKTLAAYMWAATNYPNHRLYFCYPTTGTATEGFKDYLFAPEGEQGEGEPNSDKISKLRTDLFHGRSEIDFDIILNTGPDSQVKNEEEIRIDSLKAWNTPIVACTVDTVLGIVQNNRRGLYSWPALSQSAFVFDEIHAYDDRLFGALLRFLRDLPGLPILLMTASLPQAREDALRNVLHKLGHDLKPISGPATLEERPRYHHLSVQNNDPLPIVLERMKNGDKVLWVCNTVKRVMEFAELAKDLNPLIYHSRFKYVDRVQRHKAVINAFDPKKTPGPALAICSQVAEVSLDLSADLLVTDLATVPAIIQRLGRLNRRAKKGDCTKPFVVIEPENHLPYTPADLDAAKLWLKKLATLPPPKISQSHLAVAWEQTGDQPPELVPSAWLDGGPTTMVTELREASPGITVLLNDDGQPMIAYQKRVNAEIAQAKKQGRKPDPSVYAIQPGERHPKDVVGCAIPMPPPPKHYDWHSRPRLRGILIALPNTISYDSMRGAKWE